MERRTQEGGVWQGRRGGLWADGLCQVYNPPLPTRGTSSVCLCTHLVSSHVQGLSERTEAS